MVELTKWKVHITISKAVSFDYQLAVIVENVTRGIKYPEEMLCRDMTNARICANGMRDGLWFSSDRRCVPIVVVDQRLTLKEGAL